MLSLLYAEAWTVLPTEMNRAACYDYKFIRVSEIPDFIITAVMFTRYYNPPTLIS